MTLIGICGPAKDDKLAADIIGDDVLPAPPASTKEEQQ